MLKNGYTLTRKKERKKNQPEIVLVTHFSQASLKASLALMDRRELVDAAGSVRSEGKAEVALVTVKEDFFRYLANRCSHLAQGCHNIDSPIFALINLHSRRRCQTTPSPPLRPPRISLGRGPFTTLPFFRARTFLPPSPREKETAQQ